MLATLADAPVPLTAWLRRAVIGALAALLAVGALLAVRRLVGAFHAPLPAPQLIALAVVAGVVSIGCRRLWRRLADPTAAPNLHRLDFFVAFAGTLAMILLAVGCSYPSGRAAPWLLWISLLIADQTSAYEFLRSARRPRRLPRLVEPQSPTDDQCVLQQLVRVRDDAGVEAIHGTLRADFVPGQRHATLHVGFCPPLAALPEVAAEPTDGPDATIKIVQAFAHGARLEVRLAAPATTPCHVLVDLSAAPTETPSR